MPKKNIFLTVVAVCIVLLGVEAAILYMLWGNPQTEEKITEETLDIALDAIDLHSGCADYFILDSDDDGFGDNLEKKYTTDEYNADTDGDGKNDKDEITAGENPLGDGIITLEGNKKDDWQKHEDTTYGYTIYVPADWEIEEEGNGHINIYEEARDEKPKLRLHVYENTEKAEYKDYFISWYIDATKITPIQIGEQVAQKIDNDDGVRVLTNVDDINVLAITYFDNQETERGIVNSLNVK